MNLLADESVDGPIVERLRQDGHAVVYVAELSPSVADERPAWLDQRRVNIRQWRIDRARPRFPRHSEYDSTKVEARIARCICCTGFTRRTIESASQHASLISRMVMGSFVIDQEVVTRSFPEGSGKLELIAMYEVKDDKIAKAWFIFGRKTLDAAS